MNIGFDAKRALHNKTGLGNYSRSLIGALDRYFPENDYFLFAKLTENEAFKKWAASLHHTQIVHPKNRLLDASWRSFVIPSLLARYGCRLYHGLSAELPIGSRPPNTRYIVTIHDLIFIRYPNLYHFFDRQIYFRKTLHACKTADHIIAVSQQTRRDLIELVGVSAHKISVVHLAADPIFQKPWLPQDLEALRQKLGLPRQFILNVGTLEERKNALMLLKALRLLPPELHAVFVGKPTKYQNVLDEYIAAHGLSSRVHFLNNIGFAELPGIYRLAQVLVYPSRFEGFGVPMLEAAQCGLPAIGALGSSLEEAGGPGSICVHPDDVEHLAVLIEERRKDENLRKQIRHLGLAHAERLSGQRLAEKTMDVYLSSSFL